MRLIGLTSLVDASLMPGETAKKVVLLAKHQNHVASFIVGQRHLASTVGWTKLGPWQNDTYYSRSWDGYQIILMAHPEQWGDSASVAFSTDGDSKDDMYPTLSGSGTNTDSLHWVPSLSRITGQGLKLTPDYASLEPSSGLVSVRMALPGGRIYTRLREPSLLWGFRQAGGPFKRLQVVADELHYRFKLPKDVTTFDVWGRPFTKQGGQPQPLEKLFTLTTGAAGATEIDNVFLANIRPDSFGKDETIQVGQPDWDFEHHYDLLVDGKTMTHYIPQFLGFTQVVASGSPVGSTIYCGPDNLP